MNNSYSNPEYAGIIDGLKKELGNMRKQYQVPEGGVESLTAKKAKKK